MAGAGLFTAGDLAPLLADRGIPLASVQVWRLVTQVPAPVIADALGFHYTTTTRQHTSAGAAWSLYASGGRTL
jgi:hypothetical protein